MAKQKAWWKWLWKEEKSLERRQMVVWELTVNRNSHSSEVKCSQGPNQKRVIIEKWQLQKHA